MTPVQRTRPVIAACLAMAALAACKADGTKIDISSDDLARARAGEVVMIDFQADFSMPSDLDDEQRADIDRLRSIAGQYLDISDFEIEKQDFGVKIAIEGKIPLVTAQTGSQAPWFIAVSDFSSDMDRISLENGSDFDGLEAGMQDVNFMLTPDRAQPVKFRLSLGGQASVVVPAGRIDGAPVVLQRFDSVSDLSVDISGGIFDDTGAVILISR